MASVKQERHNHHIKSYVHYISHFSFSNFPSVLVFYIIQLHNHIRSMYTKHSRHFYLYLISFQSEHFPFLGTNSSLTEMRCRTMFYSSLGRLLMFDLGEDDERFYNFLNPLTSKLNVFHNFKNINLVLCPCYIDQFESLGPVLMDANSFPNEEAKKAIIGLARDLRGLAHPLTSRVPYTMLFEWL